MEQTRGHSGGSARSGTGSLGTPELSPRGVAMEQTNGPWRGSAGGDSSLAPATPGQISVEEEDSNRAGEGAATTTTACSVPPTLPADKGPDEAGGPSPRRCGCGPDGALRPWLVAGPEPSALPSNSTLGALSEPPRESPAAGAAVLLAAGALLQAALRPSKSALSARRPPPRMITGSRRSTHRRFPRCGGPASSELVLLHIPLKAGFEETAAAWPPRAAPGPPKTSSRCRTRVRLEATCPSVRKPLGCGPVRAAGPVHFLAIALRPEEKSRAPPAFRAPAVAAEGVTVVAALTAARSAAAGAADEDDDGEGHAKVLLAKLPLGTDVHRRKPGALAALPLAAEGDRASGRSPGYGREGAPMAVRERGTASGCPDA